MRLRYGRDPAGAWRSVRPHVLHESRAGALLLDAVQVAGHTSSTAAFPAWRQFTVAAIAEVELLAERFDPDPELHLEGDKYGRVVAAVEP